MTFFQAFGYFVREACLSLVRSWKVSLVAVLTISVSLFLAGIFLLISSNLQVLVDQWRAEARVVVYLEPEASSADRQQLTEQILSASWATEVVEITSEQARQRFITDHPSLAELLQGWGDTALPASLEIALDLNAMDDETIFQNWVDELGEAAPVAMVDDDRDTLEKLDMVILVIRSLGFIVGTVLLLTAVFTISSVIRLTAYLYHDEIAVMRMVGATEFYIRGPFYMEGLLQGLLGGCVAVFALASSYQLLIESSRGSVLTAVLAGEALRPLELVALVLVGSLAGLIGSVTSLRRESLGTSEPSEEWDPA